jgi:hypothetical protein
MSGMGSLIGPSGTKKALEAIKKDLEYHLMATEEDWGIYTMNHLRRGEEEVRLLVLKLRKILEAFND